MAEYLGVDTILATPDVLEEDVNVPEWGGKLRVRSLSVDELTSMSAMAQRSKDDMFLLSKAVVDPETGKPLFRAKDIAALRSKSAGPVLRLLAVAKRLSGLDEDMVKKGERQSLLTPPTDTNSSLPSGSE